MNLDYDETFAKVEAAMASLLQVNLFGEIY
jgi:hypothetical protein